MSSTITNTTCPECGGCARSEQDTDTLDIHIFCTEENCDYDSDDDYDEDDYFDDDYYDNDDFDGYWD